MDTLNQGSARASHTMTTGRAAVTDAFNDERTGATPGVAAGASDVPREPWWISRSGRLAAAAAIVLVAAGAIVTLRLRAAAPALIAGQAEAETSYLLQWPDAPFARADSILWKGAPAPLPHVLPDFGHSAGGTLGAGGDPRFARWRQATVIVKLANGWGSGAFISADGWLLTNYHVVSSVAQTAALSGAPAAVEVVTARSVNGQTRPGEPVRAHLYRADPTRDLALLKLDRLPPGQTDVPFFPLAADVAEGEDCFVIGSQNNGPAWWIRSGSVSQQFQYPEGLSQFAAGAATSNSSVDRDRATVIVTDTRISSGDSGGPLLNTRGELIGLTFATPANRVAGSVGWHVALTHLRSFIAALPKQPEGVPFDVWTAGVSEAAMLEPELADGDGDGRVDSLRYRYAAPSNGESGDSEPRPVAMTVFVDFSERSTRTDQAADRVPFGLWGMEDQGRFHADVFLTTRADGVTAVGYANRQGTFDEIRIGRARQDAASTIWRRDSSAKWTAVTPSTPTSLIDVARVGPSNLSRLRSVAGGQLSVGATGGRSNAPGAPNAGRDVPNVVR